MIYSCLFNSIVHKLDEGEYEEMDWNYHEIGLRYDKSLNGCLTVAEKHLHEIDLPNVLRDLDLPELDKYPVDSFIEVSGIFEVSIFNNDDEPEFDLKDFCHQLIPEDFFKKD